MDYQIPVIERQDGAGAGRGADHAIVDVVVVSYNSRERIRECVEPLVAVPWANVVVVDNASPDRSVDALAGVHGVTCIAMPRNGGFSYGCNAGWRVGRAPYVLFLNPDATIAPEDLRRLVDVAAADPYVGAVGPRVVHEDGTLDFSIRRFPRLRSTFAQALFLHRLLPAAGFADELVRDAAAYGRAGAVDWLSGACLLVPRDRLERIGGFDEGFFLYSEDIDICRRIWDGGWEVRYEPGAVCRHEGGASRPRSSLLPVLASSRIRYARKHRGRLAGAVQRVGVGLGAATHVVVARGGLAMRAGHLAALRVAVTGRDPRAAFDGTAGGRPAG